MANDTAAGGGFLQASNQPDFQPERRAGVRPMQKPVDLARKLLNLLLNRFNTNPTQNTP